jgi:hypothetical protein
LITCACTETSSADTGSSATISSGLTVSALAIPIRCRCPPENSCGYLRNAVVGRPIADSNSRSGAFVCASDVSRPCALMPSTRIDCTDCRGSSDPSGSWNTICIRRRATRSGSGLSAAMFCPSKITEPSVGSISRRMPRPRVVFPHPDSPTSPYVSPGLEVHGQGGAPFGGLGAEPVGLVGEEGADEAVRGVVVAGPAQ